MFFKTSGFDTWDRKQGITVCIDIFRSYTFVNFGFFKAIQFLLFLKTQEHLSLLQFSKLNTLLGGLFEYVSAANYSGECLEWLGFAIASWSLPAWAFCFFTLANIGPRAYHHHLFYKQTFGKRYPKHRKALIPFVL